jgi:tight adherence protein C
VGAGFLLLLAAVAAMAAVSLAVTAATIPPSRREQMLKTLAAFGRGWVSTDIERRTFVTVLSPPVRRGLQVLGTVITPPYARARLAKQLNYAGNPPSWPLDKLIRARMVGGVVLALVGLMVRDHRFLGLIAGFVIGVLLPDILVRNAAIKRQQAMLRSLPDVLDALVIGVEAGLGLDAAMAQVSSMLQGPLPDEIRRVLQEMQLGVGRSVALRDLAERTTVLEVKRLVTALVQAGDLGISVAGILREHAGEQRVKRRQRAEEQAQKVAIKLLFPVMFFLFPVIFVVVIGPAVLTMIKTF